MSYIEYVSPILQRINKFQDEGCGKVCQFLFGDWSTHHSYTPLPTTIVDSQYIVRAKMNQIVVEKDLNYNAGD